uniref:Carboxylesterase type B domain-containing protein n=1 Tax=Branchiostoma floridae TaxID=7739 RepID=C3YGC9_BRAFL|eukprot:XP_002604639.1 hypothetical protein BRAFLDRAFT_92873 [Branchiostoma floridae]
MVVPIVPTASGKVRGTVQYTNDLPDKPVYTFKGIPYAAPPVGDLRFRAPQPAAPWEGVRDATELGPYCPQDTTFLNSMVVKQEHYNLDEDCLSLNVETPTIAKDAGLPVLLWIHGGGLYTGSGYFLPYASLAAHQQVVVVTFNYRLGVLGFFSTGDQNAPGNFGFLDQIQAMRWVQENIRNFGGDPDRVTIFGESAGGASVCYHVVSPLSKGLFQRAISQSGVCQTCGTFPKPLERAVMLAEELGCDRRDTANMVACLRQKSTDELNSGTLQVMKKLARQGASVPSQPFSPAVDGHFLPAEPSVLFDSGRANAVDYLLGVNNHEYGFLLPLTMIPGYGRGMTEDKYLSWMKRRIGALYPGSNQNNIVAEIRKLYRGCFSGDDPMSIQYQFTHACGDNVFVAPSVLVANKHSASGQKVYLYENHYTPSRFSAGRPDWVGCDHGDELFVMSGVAFMNVPMTSGRLLRFSADDKKASLDMMAYWANFARTGNPSDRTGGPADSPTVPEWPQYTPDNPAYMKLDLTSSTANLSDDVSLVVTTASGKVRGTVQYTNDLPDKPVYTFKGIPYAAPPVGDLRFRAPQPAAPWEGVMDATELGPYCPQDEAILKGFPVHYHRATFHEDCLTLNIETPSLRNDVILPQCSSILIRSLQPKCTTNVPDSLRLPKVQAMRWIKENIRNFGGDLDRVTIFGESAGGASVCYHVVSPLSKGLFHHAISQSGVCQTLDINPKPLERAAMFAEDLGCDTEDTTSMVTCLRQKSSDDLLASHGRLQMTLMSQGVLFPFLPVVDGTYLPSHPKDRLEKGEVNVAQYLLGANDDEYGFQIPLATIPNFGNGMSEEEFIYLLEMLVKKLYPTSKQGDIIAALREVYSYHDNPDDPMAIQKQFTQVHGDQFLVAPTVDYAEKYAGYGQVYLYENRYVSSVASAGRPDWVGCDHTDELPIISGLAFLDLPVSDDNQRPYAFSDEDKKTSLAMMAYWANFARTGNPSDRTGGPADSPTVPEWPQYTPDNPAYMKLDVTSSSDVGLKPEKMRLWNDVIPKLAASSERDEL